MITSSLGLHNIQEAGRFSVCFPRIFPRLVCFLRLFVFLKSVFRRGNKRSYAALCDMVSRGSRVSLWNCSLSVIIFYISRVCNSCIFDSVLCGFLSAFITFLLYSSRSAMLRARNCQRALLFFFTRARSIVRCYALDWKYIVHMLLTIYFR